MRLDVLLARPDLQRYSAIELKYPTALWAGDANDEHFALKNHGAQDITSYDIVKDVHRVERFVAARKGGTAVFCFSRTTLPIGGRRHTVESQMPMHFERMRV